MSIRLLGRVTEGSTIGIQWRLLKPNNAWPTITQVRWSLRNLAGAIINSRSNVTGPAVPEFVITLSGADLALEDQSQLTETRILTVQAFYDPEDGGDPLPFNEQAEFVIYNMTAVS